MVTRIGHITCNVLVTQQKALSFSAMIKFGGDSMQLTKIHQVAANVTDLDETQAFYSDVLGAQHVATFDPPGLVFFEFSGVRVLFERNNPPAVLYFWVDDIDAAYLDLVQRGVAFETKPELIHRDDNGTFGPVGSEEWMAFFKDPSGNTIALATRR